MIKGLRWFLCQVDEATGQEVLTCFLLPQQEYQHDNLGKIYQPGLHGILVTHKTHTHTVLPLLMVSWEYTW